MIEAGHPVPDAAGLEAAERALTLADGAGADDLVLVLMSGGASANWIAPAEGVSFADKQAVTRALLRSGANIGEINTVRKHLSRIKGGRLARHAYPAKLVTIAISDVPGDDPSAIGSGPTVPDPTHARRRARHRRQIQTRSAGERDRRARRRKQRIAQAGRSGLRRQPIRAGRAAGRFIARGRGRGARRRLRMRLARRQCRRRGARGGGGARQARPRAARARQARGDRLRRRTDRHHPWQGPWRAQPGICAGAGAWAWPACRRWRRSRPTPTAPMAAPAAPTTLPAPCWMAKPWRGPRRLASIPPRFLPTTIRPVSSTPLEICSCPGRPYTNVNDFRAIVVDRP